MKKLTIILTAFFLTISLGLLAQDMNEAGQAYNEGIGLAKENKTAEAIASYQKCADICAGLGEDGAELQEKAETQITSLYLKQGIDAYKAKRYDDAIASFKLSAEYAEKVNKAKSVSKAKSYIAATYTAKGNSFVKEKSYEEALASFKEAVAVKPKYFKAYYGMAIAYNKTDQAESMEEAVNKVVEYGGDDKVVAKAISLAATYYLNLSATYLQKESFNEASMMAKKAIEFNEQEGMAYYYQALADNNRGQYDEAVKIAMKGLTIEGADMSNLYFELGRAHENKGDAQKACEAYKKVNDGPNVDAANYQRTTVLKCN